MKKIIAAAMMLASSMAFASDRPDNVPDTAVSFQYSGGCFWCTEADSEKLEGVYEAISGFTGGTTPDPVYQRGGWGDHREAAKVWYNPTVLNYADLVNHVYTTVDYQDASGQFCDGGRSYQPAIYFTTEQEKTIAQDLAPASSVVPIEQSTRFYPVRDNQQGYYKGTLTKLKYRYYRLSCGRDSRLLDLQQERISLGDEA